MWAGRPTIITMAPDLPGSKKASQSAGYSKSSMKRTNVYLKIEVEHDAAEAPQRIGEEFCRQLLKLYGVRLAEVTGFSSVEE